MTRLHPRGCAGQAEDGRQQRISNKILELVDGWGHNSSYIRKVKI
jgi:hypothetical protein